MALAGMDRRFAQRALEPRYSFVEASGLIGRSPVTVRRWSVGNLRRHKGKPRVDDPLISIDGERDHLPLSFLNLLELRFLANYREGASMQAIRRALEFAAVELGAERPLLELDFAIQGRELFLAFAAEEPVLLNASRGGQLQLAAWPPATERFLASLEYDEAERAAYQWWPLGKKRPVVVDTGLNAGRPSTSKTAVRTVAIKARKDQGWADRAVQADLGATAAEIHAAMDLEALVA